MTTRKEKSQNGQIKQPHPWGLGTRLELCMVSESGVWYYANHHYNSWKVLHWLTLRTDCSSSLVKKSLTCINPLSKNCSSCHCSSCPGFFSKGWGGITVYTSGAAAAASNKRANCTDYYILSECLCVALGEWSLSIARDASQWRG